METKIVQVVHGRQKHHIALYGGMAADELCTLLRSMFGLPAAVQVVGLSSRAGDALVVPLALACAAPQSLASPNGYQLLLAGDQALLLQQQQEEEEEETEEEVADEEEEDEDEEEEEGEVDELALEEEEYDRDMVGAQAPAAAAAAGADGSAVNQEDFSKLIRFFQILRQRRMISKASADTLEELLFENNSLLRAAYEVAAVAGDAGYLAVLCRDIAANKQTADGQAVCAAQEDLLLVCDMFRQEGHISEGQLFNLRHLILVRDEAMVNIYDNYQMTQDARSLMVSLLHMAQKYPADGGVESAVAAAAAASQGARAIAEGGAKAVAGDDEEEEGEDDEEEDDEDDEEEDDYERGKAAPARRTAPGVRARKPQPAVPRPEAPTPMGASLSKLVDAMQRAGQLSVLEAELLRRLISDENEYIVAAYEVFEIDGNERELRDTLTRLARILAKRIEEGSGGAASASATESVSTSAAAADLPQPPSRHTVRIAEDASKGKRDEGDDADEDGPMNTALLEADPRARGIMQRSVTELIESLGLRNQWNDSVPAAFLLIVWSAVKAGVLTKEEATYLCNLYASDDDMVNAAWQVYRVHPDERDVIDTLIRICRPLRGSAAPLFPSPAARNRDSNAAVPASGATADADADAGDDEDADENDGSEDDDTDAEAKRAQAVSRMREQQDRVASAALDKAHLELLSQALQFMIKQDMIGIDPAKELLMRAARGDAVVRGATECFMADKNVAEYLDTLHIIGDQIARDMGQPPTEEQSRNAATVSAIAASSASALGVGGGNADDDDADADDDGVGSSDVAGSSNNGGDGAGTDPTVVQQRLQAVANQLYKDGQINDVENTTLLQLIADRDDRIMAAYEVFTKLNDVADFVDSLLRIVKREAVVRTRAMSTERDEEGIELLSMNREGDEDGKQAGGARSAIEGGQKSDATETGDSAGGSDENGDAEDDGDDAGDDEGDDRRIGSLLGPADFLQVIDMLTRAGSIPQSRKAALDTMARNKHPEMVKCFNDYESHSNVETLIQDVNALAVATARDNSANDNAAAANGDATSQAQENGVESAATGANAENNNDDDDGEADAEVVQDRFFQIVASMRLSDLETAALRLAITRADPNIKAALELFRLQQNESDLQDTLRRIARHTIQASMLQQREAEAEEDGNESANADNESADSDQPSIGNNNADQATSKNNSSNNDSDEDEDDAAGEDDAQDDGDDDDDDDDDDDNDDDDDDDDDDAGALPRDEFFPMLMAEMTTSGLVSKNEGEKLLEMFQGENPVILASLDVYDADRELGDLVDTLQRLVRN